MTTTIQKFENKKVKNNKIIHIHLKQIKFLKLLMKSQSKLKKSKKLQKFNLLTSNKHKKHFQPLKSIIIGKELSLLLQFHKPHIKPKKLMKNLKHKKC